MEVKIKVISVTDYERNSVKIAGLSSHEDDAEIYALLAKEIASKEQNGDWPTALANLLEEGWNAAKKKDYGYIIIDWF